MQSNQRTQFHPIYPLVTRLFILSLWITIAIDKQAFSAHLKNRLTVVAPISLPLSNEIVNSSVQELCELIAESATVSKKNRLLSVARGKMPWWSHALCALRTKTRHALKQWSNCKTIENRDAYGRCKSIYQRELRIAKKNNFLEVSDKSGKNLFKVLKKMSGEWTTIPLPTEITVKGCTLNQPVKILEACARHFFPDNPPSDPFHSEVEASVCAGLSSSSLGSYPPVTLEELSAAVFSLKTGTSPGLDRITPELLQSSYNVTKRHLLALMNACFHLELFPDQWKIAKVTVIGKCNKLDYSSLNSFRPISVANCMAKILEKLILGHLMWFSRSSNWLSDSQHGFLEGRSTETAAHSLVSHIEFDFSSKEHAACAFFDIKSAFDSAWHPAILLALVKRSCPPYLIKLIRSFLSNRKARLSLANESVETTVNMGWGESTPPWGHQGGVLSPFLWVILVDDLLRCSFPFPFVIIAYADDITVCVSHKDQAIACRNLQIVWLHCQVLRQKQTFPQCFKNHSYDHVSQALWDPWSLHLNQWS